MTDRMSADDFRFVFRRTSKDIRFGRVQSYKDIRTRIRNMLRSYRIGYQKAKHDSTKIRYRQKYKKLKRLDDGNFHITAWNQAIDEPGGFIDNTLDYGHDNAVKMERQRMRRKFGRMRRVT